MAESSALGRMGSPLVAAVALLACTLISDAEIAEKVGIGGERAEDSGAIGDDSGGDSGTDPADQDNDSDGFTETEGDCDDANASVHPSAIETCATTADDNCDGSTNDVGATGCTTYYYDGDGDGAGQLSPSQCTCIASENFDVTEVTPSNEDCDDMLESVNPDALEICGDGLDNDCNGTDRSCVVVTTLEGINFVNVAASTFEMGCTTGQMPHCGSDEPLHVVTLSQDYYVSETEVTQAQFEALMGYNPSHFVSCGDDCPVEDQSWHESAAFANALSTAGGRELCYTCTGTGPSSACSVAMDPYVCVGYRMLTEAEWEGAARCGEDVMYAGSTDIDEVAWYSGNSSSTMHAVGGKAPNECGLYDMSGNAWEWTQDWYDSLSTEAESDPVGTSSGTERVVRGGYWNGSAPTARVADRYSYEPTYAYSYVGIRLARSKP